MFVDTDMSFLVVKRKGSNFNILTKATTILEFEIVERQFQVTSEANFFSISHTQKSFFKTSISMKKKKKKPNIILILRSGLKQ